MLDLSQAAILCNIKENEWRQLDKMVKNLILSLILVCLTQICGFYLY